MKFREEYFKETKYPKKLKDQFQLQQKPRIIYLDRPGI
jgi:hypothetical protein